MLRVFHIQTFKFFNRQQLFFPEALTSSLLMFCFSFMFAASVRKKRLMCFSSKRSGTRTLDTCFILLLVSDENYSVQKTRLCYCLYDRKQTLNFGSDHFGLYKWRSMYTLCLSWLYFQMVNLQNVRVIKLDKKDSFDHLSVSMLPSSLALLFLLLYILIHMSNFTACFRYTPVKEIWDTTKV